MTHWKKITGGDWYAWIGNNLYIYIEKVKVWESYPKKRGGRYVYKYCPTIQASLSRSIETMVRQWTGGGDGHGNYSTLKEAKKAGLTEAEYVGKAVLNLVSEIRSARETLDDAAKGAVR